MVSMGSNIDNNKITISSTNNVKCNMAKQINNIIKQIKRINVKMGLIEIIRASWVRYKKNTRTQFSVLKLHPIVQICTVHWRCEILITTYLMAYFRNYTSNEKC